MPNITKPLEESFEPKRAHIRDTTLTDGSHVYDVIVVDNDNACSIELNCVTLSAALTLLQAIADGSDCAITTVYEEASH